MEAEQILGLAPALDRYLANFDDCFGRSEPIAHLRTYVNGQLSDLPRKSVEPMALAAGTPPRTLQQFLSDTRWDQGLMCRKVQQIVARDHAHPHAVGVFDETTFVKKGDKTPGVKRQYCGASGKIDNCTASVHLTYSTPNSFIAQLDAELFLPEDWSQDRKRCRACGIPDDVVYRPKWRIALDLHERAVANGMMFPWMTFDEGYGLIPAFLHGLDDRKQLYVGEVPSNFVGWCELPTVWPAGSRRPGVAKGPCLRVDQVAEDSPVSRVDDLCQHSPEFSSQPWLPMHVKDTTKGPVVWEVKTARFYLKRDGMASDAHWLIVARNMLDRSEVKYFISNAPAGTPLEVLLHVGFSRWTVERNFEDQKTELGMDHFEARTWTSLQRHLAITSVTLLFLARMREQLRGEKSPGPGGADRLPGSDCGRRHDCHLEHEPWRKNTAHGTHSRRPGIHPAQKCHGVKMPQARNAA